MMIKGSYYVRQAKAVTKLREVLDEISKKKQVLSMKNVYIDFLLAFGVGKKILRETAELYKEEHPDTLIEWEEE